MPEDVIGAVWAFCWGLVAASGTLVGVIFGLITHLRHRAIAAFMSSDFTTVAFALECARRSAVESKFGLTIVRNDPSSDA